MSIQRSLDGHSFSVDGLDRDYTGEAVVTVEILTPQTLLVPAELLGDADSGLFAAAGMACQDGEAVVRSMPRMVGATEVVALMVLDAKLLQQIREHVGYRAEFTTPLLEGPMAAQQTVWLRHAPGVLYIKVFGRSLRLAEAIPAADDADILYFIDRLGRALPLRQMRLHLGGPRAKALRKIVGRRFKRVVCES